MQAWVLKAIVALLLLAGGFAAGAYFGHSFAMDERWLAAVDQSHRASIYAYVQYRQADYAAAKVALSQFLDLLESAQPTPPDEKWHPGVQPFVDKRGLAFDKMLTAARLALLEERQNGAIEAEQWWAKAEGYAQAAEWKDPGRQHIRAVVERLDNEDRPTQAPVTQR